MTDTTAEATTVTPSGVRALDFSSLSIDQVAELINTINKQHGFWPEKVTDRNFGEAIALAHSELSEALEENRSSKPSYYEIGGKPEGWAVELIDCAIRILDMLAGYLPEEAGEVLTIEQILQNKIAYNAGRPFKHGRGY